jgi:hypothetical protein
MSATHTGAAVNHAAPTMPALLRIGRRPCVCCRYSAMPDASMPQAPVHTKRSATSASRDHNAPHAQPSDSQNAPTMRDAACTPAPEPASTGARRWSMRSSGVRQSAATGASDGVEAVICAAKEEGAPALSARDPWD